MRNLPREGHWFSRFVGWQFVWTVLLLELPVFTSANDDRTNPFTRPAYQQVEKSSSGVAAPELQLRAVSTSGKSPLANINGMVLSTGEYYLDFKITHIAKDRVTVTKNDHSIDLYLWQTEEEK